MTTPPITINADQVNCLVHAYLRDSGFQHSAFNLRQEGKLDQSASFRKHIERGKLLELLSQALLYVEVATHTDGNSVIANCTAPFSLIEPHACALDPKAPHKSIIGQPATNGVSKPSQPVPPPPRPSALAPRTNGVSESGKRKADASLDSPSEKRQRTEEMDIDPSDSAAKAKTPVTPATQYTSTSNAVASTSNSGPSTSAPAPAQAVAPATSAAAAGEQPIVKKTKAKRISRPIGANEEGTARMVALLKGHKKEVFNCAWSPVGKLASGSKDGVINLWDFQGHDKHKTPITYQSITEFSQEKDGDVTALSWTSDGELLGIGSYDSVVRVCASNGKSYLTASRHQGPIFSIRFSPSNKWMVTASLDGLACVWDVKARTLHAEYRPHKSDSILDTAWLDDSTFATCGSDGMIFVLDLNRKPAPGMEPSGAAVIKALKGHVAESDINQIHCNPTRTRMASCSDDNTCRIWNVTKAALQSNTAMVNNPNNVDSHVVLRGHTGSVCGVTWCPTIKLGGHEIVATGSFDRTVRVWDTVTGDCVKIFTDHKRAVFTIQFSPDGLWLASGGGDGTVYIYNTKTMKRVWTWFAGAERPGVYEIDWQQKDGLSRIALALENTSVGVIDTNLIPLVP